MPAFLLAAPSDGILSGLLKAFSDFKQPMRHPFYALKKLPHGPRPQRLASALFSFALVSFSPVTFAQSGSVTFEISAMQELTSLESTDFSFADRVFYHLKGSRGSTPSFIMLRDFGLHTQFPDFDDADGIPIYTMIPEYLGLVYDGNGTLTEISEAGYVAMQIEAKDTNGVDDGVYETVVAAGSGVAGFVRTNQNPSSLAQETPLNFFDGLNGVISWDFQAANRAVFLTGSGAQYDLFNTQYSATASLSYSTEEEIQIIGLFLQINGATNERWSFFNPTLILDDDLTETNTYFTYEGPLLLSTLPSDTALSTLPAEYDQSVYDFNSFQFDYYIFEIFDDSDSDGDGIPDLTDLNGIDITTRPSHATEQFGDEDWFYSPFFQDWFYSPTIGGWDYSIKLGWIYDLTSTIFDPNSFWFYLQTPEGNTSSFGWLWTSEAVFPWFYRSADDAWIELISSNPGSSSTFYNLSTDAEETLNF